MQLPLVTTKSTRLGHVAAASWVLRELQALSPEPNGSPVKEALVAMHQAGTRLLEWFAGWDLPAVLELHLISQPSLSSRTNPQTRVGIRLYGSGKDRVEALERCLGLAITLQGLLNATWPGAEFRPIEKREELEQLFRPFEPASGLRVRRRLERILLTKPFERERKGTLGFTTGPDRQSSVEAKEEFSVEHCFPWIPSGDDWGLLLDTLLRFPVPRWLLVRLGNRAVTEAEMRRLESTVETCERFLACGPGVTLAAQTQALRDASLVRLQKLRECALQGAVFLLSPGAPN